MVPKLEQCYRVLKKSGAMYLHCDWQFIIAMSQSFIFEPNHNQIESDEGDFNATE